MKTSWMRLVCGIVMGAVVGCCAAASVWAQPGPEFTDPTALRDAATQAAVSSLLERVPDELEVTSLGLVPFDGDDDGGVTNALAVALSERADFDLKQLPRLGPETSEAALASAGREAGVGALLLGEVVDSELTTGSARVALSARIVGTGDGRELWRGEAEGERKSAVGRALSVESVVEKTLDEEGLVNAAYEGAAQRLVGRLRGQLPSRVGLMPVVGDVGGGAEKHLTLALSGEAEVVSMDVDQATLDSAAIAAAGREAGVETVLAAQLERSKVLLGRADVILHGRVIRSRDGIIMAAATVRQIHQTHVGRYRWLLVAGAAVLLLVAAAVIVPRVLRRARRAVPGQATALRERELGGDERLRRRTVREIRGCLDHLKALGDAAVAEGRTERHRLLQQLRGDLDQLRLEIENAPFGHHPELAKAAVNERDLGRLREVEQRVVGMVESLHRELRQFAEKRAESDIDGRLEALRRDVSDISDRFRERENILAGIRA